LPADNSDDEPADRLPEVKKSAKKEQRHRFQIFVRPAELKARRCAASRHQFSTTSEKLQQNEHFPVENYD